MKKKVGIVYFGALITADGRPQAELNRRIGAAGSDFDVLISVRNHAGISQIRKLQLIDAYVILMFTQLFYALQTCWLTTAELDRLDSFYCRCLRRILRIPPAYVSRVLNAEVYSQTGRRPVRTRLLLQQLMLYGHVVRLPNDDVLCLVLIRPDDVRPVNFNFKLRGGQRVSWVEKVFDHAVKVVDGLPVLRILSADRAKWKQAVARYVTEILC